MHRLSQFLTLWIMTEIRGSKYYDLGIERSTNGHIKFPLSFDLSTVPVCGVQLLNSVEAEISPMQVPNKVNGERNQVFINLFDSRGIQFAYDVPAFQLYYQVYGGPLLFRPRILDPSKCYLRFFNQAAFENASFALLIFFGS